MTRWRAHVRFEMRVQAAVCFRGRAAGALRGRAAGALRGLAPGAGTPDLNDELIGEPEAMLMINTVRTLLGYFESKRREVSVAQSRDSLLSEE